MSGIPLGFGIVVEDKPSELSCTYFSSSVAVALPIVSVLIIATFLSLSVYAHYRYPHVSYKVNKGHENKAPDVL